MLKRAREAAKKNVEQKAVITVSEEEFELMLKRAREAAKKNVEQKAVITVTH
jgi:uncharacterized protein (DUF1778 family)